MAAVQEYGKFKKPRWRTTTPYDRSMAVRRNPNTWFSDFLSQAQRLVASAAHRLVNRLFHLHQSEANHEESIIPPELVSTEHTRVQGAINGHDDLHSSFDRGGLTQVEEIFKQKTTTGLLQKGSNIVSLNGPLKENVNGDQLISTPVASSTVLYEDVASPSELENDHMGNKPSKVSASMPSLHSHAFKEESTVLSSRPVPSESGFVTPRSQDRNVISRMAQAFDSRVHSTTTLKVLKRKSSILDNDIDSISPIRSVRQKLNLECSENLSLADSRVESAVAFDVGCPVAYENHAAISSQSKLPSHGKRKSSIRDSDIDSISPIRSVRQKLNLECSENLSLADSRVESAVAFDVGCPVAYENGAAISSQSKLPSHGKKIHTDYSVINIPGDGRCLFRSVVYGACLGRFGISAPVESLEGDADLLRARVVDEFIERRRKSPDIDWLVEGDFFEYISKIRIPHVEGGEPELVMASHVLQMPIIVYVYDNDAGGVRSFTEYGQEYDKENPIRVLYDGSCHYDALHIPGKRDEFSTAAASTPLAEGRDKLDASLVENKTTLAEASAIEKSAALSGVESIVAFDVGCPVAASGTGVAVSIQSKLPSHGNILYTDFSVTNIPGDGRCLFRSVVYGACLGRFGISAPIESLEGDADLLRARVVDEFIERRKKSPDIDWLVEGDFYEYISKIRMPHVEGGEPELVMASHVLQMPIIVYIFDNDAGGVRSFTEYGQEYGKENPIRVLYNGSCHYDALHVPAKR